MKRMPMVYVAGRYRANTERALVLNIRLAESAALKIWRAGGAALCPHKNTAHFGGACEDRVWLEGDIEMLRRCDGVFMCNGWELSEGAKAELQFAREQSIPVRMWDDDEPDLRLWIDSLPYRWDVRGGVT